MSTALRLLDDVPAATPARGAARAAERERLTGPPLDGSSRARTLGWVAALAITALAALLRFWHLGTPHALVFDETYYVKDAYTLAHHGYELAWPTGADADFIKGRTEGYLAEAGTPTHPPLGKWMIAVGEELFGISSSTGWRFSSAVVGTSMVLMACRIGRRLLRSTVLGCVAGLLLAVDGLHLVMSRTGILDIFLAFWVLAAFGVLLIDRDSSRARLAAAVVAGSRWPLLWWRPWRFAAAVCLGAACGVKWSGIYVIAGFAVMTVLWDVAARRRAGLRHWWLGLVADGVPAAVTVLPIALATYLACWTGWFVTAGGHLRQWAQQNPGQGVAWLPPALRSLWEYHRETWRANDHFNPYHSYMSNPWSWSVQGRPTSFYVENLSRGQSGCATAKCVTAIDPIGNPVIWWAGTLCLLVLLFRWALARDWRAGAILMGVAVGWLPWFDYFDRTIFTYYTVIFSPFMVFAVTYTAGLLASGSRGAGGSRAVTAGPRLDQPLDQRRLAGLAVAGLVVVGAVVAAAWFWPVWTAHQLSWDEWHRRMWLRSWI